MAYLPPKNPNNWSTPLPPRTTTATMPASWVDEFLDFSCARRGLHRRTMSDSMAFYEDPPESFDRLDDQQLMSMFSYEAAGVSNPSTPSDHNSANENSTDVGVAVQAVDEKAEVQSENRQGESSATTTATATITMAVGAGSDPNVDAKRVKRILANRQSAQRSRVRKLHYISELERSVTSLQSEVSALSPRVAFLDHQRLILNVDNSALKQRIAVLAQDKLFKDAHQEALKKEIERLRMVYQEQNVKKVGTYTDPPIDIGMSN